MMLNREKIRGNKGEVNQEVSTSTLEEVVQGAEVVLKDLILKIFLQALSVVEEEEEGEEEVEKNKEGEEDSNRMIMGFNLNKMMVLDNKGKSNLKKLILQSAPTI